VKRVAHLVVRFFGSLRPHALDAATVAWVERTLEPNELRVWAGLVPADRAEAVAVARRLEAALGSDVDSTWTAAALLHDVGKQASAYGPLGRALVTVVAALAGQERVRGWAGDPRGARGRMGRYAAHDDVGAGLLAAAGARPAVTAWAGAHHRPGRWASTGIPRPVCRALAAADGEPIPMRGESDGEVCR
jgi:hypothetical protein